MKIPQGPKSGPMPDTRADDRPQGSFIVNLCALPGPAVPQFAPTELAGLRPFVSRRTKDGGERFYLHVGFFQTLFESEKWLNAVRTTYPNAFVSKLSDTPRSGEPDAPPVADTQVLRVLEVRGPTRVSESAEVSSYAVHAEARVLGTRPETRAVTPPMPSPAPQPRREKPAATADAKKAPRGLSAALNDLALSEFELANTDLSRTTGVRHLRVEIQRKARRPLKSSKTRKV